MPVIRRRVHSYTTNWNTHRIQHQNSPGFISGRPSFNYYYSKIADLRCPINSDPTSAQAQLFQKLQQDVRGWDSNEYLPLSTLAWCKQQLAEIGEQLAGIPFNPEDPDLCFVGDQQAPYRAVYEALRERAFAHWDAGRDPILDVCAKPIGAANWRPNVSEEM
jgi:hypothetical protein